MAPLNILYNSVKTLHWEVTLAFLCHCLLVFYRTIEADVKFLAVLDERNVLLVVVPLGLRETIRLVHLHPQSSRRNTLEQV